MRRGRRAAGAALLIQPALPVLGVWLALGTAMAALTYRLADWFKVPDEIVFERLALSIARGHSPIPRIHGEFIRSLAQLYPLLISPILAGGYVVDDLQQIRVLNAMVITSAFVPAYLLAVRVTRRVWAGYLVGFLSVCVPWVVLGGFLLTEVVALPAFLWAVLAIQHTLVRPSPRADVLALAGIALAFTARTQFVLLLGVLFVCAVAVPGPRAAVRRHRVLAAFYGAAALAGVVFVAAGGHVLSLSIYGQQFGRGIATTDVPGWALAHLADLAYCIGILPLVVGGGWLLANCVHGADPERRAFAWVATATIAFLTWGVATFDLQLGGFVFDRYLFYLVPLVVLAFVCALLDPGLPRLSVALPAVLVAAGFLLHFQQEFTWSDPARRINSDAPSAIFYRPLVDAVGSRGAAAWTCAGVTVALAVAFAVGARRVPQRRLAAVLIGLVAVGLPAATGYTFHRLYATGGYSGRSLTATKAGVLDWVDRTVGTSPRVTIVPAPVSSDYLVTERYWRDIEFWNKSVARHLIYPGPGAYAYTGYWFPKLTPRFDARTGASDLSPTRYVVQSVSEARFRVAGTTVQQTGEATLVDAGSRWRLAWLASRLTSDGWTEPNAAARIRVYAAPGQQGASIRYMTLRLRAPENAPARPTTVTTNLQRRAVAATPDGVSVDRLLVCVPAGAGSDVVVRATGSSAIPGDQRTLETSLVERVGGVLLSGIFLSDETGGPCDAGGG
jgi:hypothetical protein